MRHSGRHAPPPARMVRQRLVSRVAGGPVSVWLAGPEAAWSGGRRPPGQAGTPTVGWSSGRVGGTRSTTTWSTARRERVKTGIGVPDVRAPVGRWRSPVHRSSSVGGSLQRTSPPNPRATRSVTIMDAGNTSGQGRRRSQSRTCTNFPPTDAGAPGSNVIAAQPDRTIDPVEICQRKIKRNSHGRHSCP